MYCIKCGKELKAGAKFCTGCGTPVKDVTPQKDPASTLQPTQERPNEQPMQAQNIKLTQEKPSERPTQERPSERPTQERPSGQPTQERPNIQPTQAQNFQQTVVPEKKGNGGKIALIIALIIVIIGLCVAGGIFAMGILRDRNETNQNNNKDSLNYSTENTEDDDKNGTETVETEEPTENVVVDVTEPKDDKTAETGKSNAGKGYTRMEEQCFEVELVPVGKVTFVSYAPNNENADARFVLEEKGVETYVFEHSGNTQGVMRFNNGTTTYKFLSVEEVFFQDYNKDTVDDVLINCSYQNVSNPSDIINETRIYRGSASGEFYLQPMLSQLADASMITDSSIWYFKEQLASLYSNYDLPYSDSQYYTAEDLKMLTPEQLRYARNEIYARHGYVFSDSELQAHFSSRNWYSPIRNNNMISDSVLNEFELHNKNLLVELEQRPIQ